MVNIFTNKGVNFFETMLALVGCKFFSNKMILIVTLFLGRYEGCGMERRFSISYNGCRCPRSHNQNYYHGWWIEQGLGSRGTRKKRYVLDVSR